MNYFSIDVKKTTFIKVILCESTTRWLAKYTIVQDCYLRIFFHFKIENKSLSILGNSKESTCDAVQIQEVFNNIYELPTDGNIAEKKKKKNNKFFDWSTDFSQEAVNIFIINIQCKCLRHVHNNFLIMILLI